MIIFILLVLVISLVDFSGFSLTSRIESLLYTNQDVPVQKELDEGISKSQEVPSAPTPPTEEVTKAFNELNPTPEVTREEELEALRRIFGGEKK